MFVPPVGYDVKAASFPAVLERDNSDRNNIFRIIFYAYALLPVSLFGNCETTIHQSPPVFRIGDILVWIRIWVLRFTLAPDQDPSCFFYVSDLQDANQK